MSVAAQADASLRPVTLEAVRTGDDLRIAVIGQSDRPVTVAYHLEAQAGDAANANRSTQTGSAKLHDNERRTLINLHLRAAKSWQTRLSVTVDGGQTYQIERSEAGEG